MKVEVNFSLQEKKRDGEGERENFFIYHGKFNFD